MRIFTETSWVDNESPGNFHYINADIIAFDAVEQIIRARTENGDTQPLATSLHFEMPKPPGGDILPAIEWECIVGLVAHGARIGCNDYGEVVSLAIYEQRLLSDLNPLRYLGYLGWPGMLVNIEGMETSLFRRI